MYVYIHFFLHSSYLSLPEEHTWACGSAATTALPPSLCCAVLGACVLCAWKAAARAGSASAASASAWVEPIMAKPVKKSVLSHRAARGQGQEQQGSPTKRLTGRSFFRICLGFVFLHNLERCESYLCFNVASELLEKKHAESLWKFQ